MRIPGNLYASIDARIRNWDVLPSPRSFSSIGNVIAVGQDLTFLDSLAGPVGALNEKSCPSALRSKCIPTRFSTDCANFTADDPREPDSSGNARGGVHRVSGREARTDGRGSVGRY